MSPRRAGRAEVVSTVAVIALVIVGIVALWPHTPTGTSPGATAGTDAATAAPAVTDADLAPLRAAAALAPCPAPGGAPAAGALRGIAVPCLGAPGAIDVGAALAGRPALLNVWASWCAPCRAELPALAEYAARPGAVAVLGVDVGDDPRAALSLLQSLGVRLPSVADPEGTLRNALHMPPLLPMSYVVRADGTILRVDPPAPFTSADQVAAAVERLR